MLKSVFLIALAGIASASPLVSIGQSVFNAETNGTDPKVNVTLYVMSRCPDAVSLVYVEQTDPDDSVSVRVYSRMSFRLKG
jgi:hypothetical protein